jgi:hypothetical protein
MISWCLNFLTSAMMLRLKSELHPTTAGSHDVSPRRSTRHFNGIRGEQKIIRNRRPHLLKETYRPLAAVEVTT